MIKYLASFFIWRFGFYLWSACLRWRNLAGCLSFFFQVLLQGFPPASSFNTHLLHYAGDNWWGEGWSQTHTSQPHSNAWGCHLFLWCDSALYRGCSHWNRRNINVVVINKQYLDTNMSTSIRLYFLPSQKDGRCILTCVSVLTGWPWMLG